MIDWPAAKARLAEINRAVETAARPSPERDREVMAARAIVLGRASTSVDVGKRIDLVRFGCGDERFAFQTAFVRATLKLPKLTPVPFGPAALLGLCAFRGQLLSVWNPAELLTGASAAAADWLLVLGEGKAEVGLAVKDVSFVQQLPARDVMPLPEALSGSKTSQLFEGVITEGSIRVLSGEAILAAPQLSWT